jgi:hypothetical protein
MYDLDPAVIAEAKKHFAADDLAHVLTKLKNTPLPLDRGGPPPRIHLAVLWLAKGDRARFDRELEGAACDWRDTLVAAGLANEDWPKILATRGIDLR